MILNEIEAGWNRKQESYNAEIHPGHGSYSVMCWHSFARSMGWSTTKNQPAWIKFTVHDRPAIGRIRISHVRRGEFDLQIARFETTTGKCLRGEYSLQRHLMYPEAWDWLKAIQDANPSTQMWVQIRRYGKVKR